MSFQIKLAGVAGFVLAATLAAPAPMAIAQQLPSIGDHPELVDVYSRMQAGGAKTPESDAHVVWYARPSFNDHPEHYRDAAGVIPPMAGCPSEAHVVSATGPSFNDNPEHYRQVTGC